MHLKIERGLFKYDFIDHHAVLGVPLDADLKEIRKRYLTIARRLHPDSCSSDNSADKQLASELLSKLVNPAYEKLSHERSRSEYMIVLSQMGKRLMQESASVELTNEKVKQLASSPAVEQLYKTAIAKIATTQYDSLEKVIQTIALLSELNLVYLMRSAGKSITPPSAAQPQINQSTAKPVISQNRTEPKIKPDLPSPEISAVTQYIRRAQELMAKNQFASARLELQDALKLEPNNSHCHSLIGVVYLKQNQTTMAKVHFDRALQLNPKDQTALEGKLKIDQILGKKPGGTKPVASSNAGVKQPDKSGGGGLFGGLFGGKKN